MGALETRCYLATAASDLSKGARMRGMASTSTSCNQPDYVVHWINLLTPDLPVNFNQDHLRTHIKKGSKSDMDILKAGRDSTIHHRRR